MPAHPTIRAVGSTEERYRRELRDSIDTCDCDPILHVRVAGGRAYAVSSTRHPSLWRREGDPLAISGGANGWENGMILARQW